MPTPLHLKPATAAWIVTERRRLGLKPRDLVERLAAMGLEVSEDTVKVWESNADRRPSPYNLEGLERIFGSKAPVRGQPAAGSADNSAVVAAIDRLREAVERQTEQQATGMTALAEVLGDVLGQLGGLPGRMPAGSPDPVAELR